MIHLCTGSRETISGKGPEVFERGPEECTQAYWGKKRRGEKGQVRKFEGPKASNSAGYLGIFKSHGQGGGRWQKG